MGYRLYCSYGLPPIVLPENHQSASIRDGLTDDLLSDSELTHVMATANLELGRIGLDENLASRSKDIQSMIGLFSAQIDRLHCVGSYGM